MSEWFDSEKAWMRERDWWGDYHAIRITCGNKDRPRHKGKEIHITELGKKCADNGDWRISRKERERIERHGGFTEQHPDPFSYQGDGLYTYTGKDPLILKIIEESRAHFSGPANELKYSERMRFEVTCPKCDDHVGARQEVLRFILDGLMQKGWHKITLQGLQSVLSRHDAVAAGGPYGLGEARGVPADIEQYRYGSLRGRLAKKQ